MSARLVGKAYAASSEPAAAMPVGRNPIVLPDGLTERLGVLKMGDADLAAKALIAIVPNAEAYLQHHDVLLDAAEAGQGKMNLDLLRKAGPDYHAWHAEQVIVGPSRGLTILQWMSQKIWEAPRSEVKETAAKTFVEDVTCWIDAGRMEGWRGGALARDTVMDVNKGIRSGVSTAPLLTLYKKLVLAEDKPSREDLLFTPLCAISYMIEGQAEGQDFLQFIGTHYLDFDPRNPSLSQNQVPGVSWDMYETLPSLSYEQLGEVIETRCRVAGSYSFLGLLAAKRLLSDYRTQPGAVVSLVMRPNVVPNLTLPLCDAILATEGDIAFLAQDGGLLEPFVAEISMKAGVRGRLYPSYARCADRLLQRLDASEVRTSAFSTIALEKGLVLALLRAGRVRETDIPGTGLSENAPIERLVKRKPALSPEAKQYLRDTVQGMLDDPQTYVDLEPKGKEDLQNALTVLLATP